MISLLLFAFPPDSVAHPVLDHADAAAVSTITTNPVGVPKKMATKIDVSVFGKRNLRRCDYCLTDILELNPTI